MKECIICGQKKENIEFPIYPNPKLNRQCLQCRREKMKKTREEKGTYLSVHPITKVKKWAYLH